MERGCPEGMEAARAMGVGSRSEQNGLIGNSGKWIDTLQEKQPQAGSEHCSPADGVGFFSPWSQHRSTLDCPITEAAAEAAPVRNVKARSSARGAAIFNRT